MHCTPRPLLAALSILTAISLATVSAQTVEQLVTTLAKAESLDDEAIGIAGTKSQTYQTYEALRERATREELLQLAEHTSAIVRGYAVRALADRKEAVDWPKLLQARAKDTTKVATFEGCIRSERPLGDVVFEWARHRELLTNEQWLDIGEHLLTTNSPLYAREWALRTLQFRDGMLDKVRACARSGDGPAHVALARYRQAKDLTLLVAWLGRDGVFDDNTAFLAAQAFPDPSLLTVLVGLEQKARTKISEGLVPRLREWLAAITLQRSPAAAQFLTRFLAETPVDVHHREVVHLYKQVLVELGADDTFASVREELKRHARR